ncbi:Calx-beta domain-containing protein [Candidatus Palauibacter sp.]|uniref:Calx-beta domain-containing protein n=1 Tax=Candidatus Palauibacter sp. TaxID=3101350 RepID=UPI003B02D245
MRNLSRYSARSGLLLIVAVAGVASCGGDGATEPPPVAPMLGAASSDVATAGVAFGSDASSTKAYTVMAAEGGPVYVPVTISHLPGESAAFGVEVLDTSTATVGYDFGDTSDLRVTFGPGDGVTTKHLPLIIRSDREDDDGETIVLRIVPKDEAARGYARHTSGSTATITIMKDVVSVAFTSVSYWVSEGGRWALGVAPSAAPSSDIKVSLAWEPRLAGPGSSATGGGVDYTAGPSAVTVDSGSTAATDIVFEVNDDDLVEGHEDFILTLAASAGYAAGWPASALVTIIDEEAEDARIAFGSDASSTETYAVTVDEGGTLNVPVTVSHLPGESVTFEVVVLGDCTATDGSDFHIPLPTVTFGPEDAGKTQHLAIDIARDSWDDDGETIMLRIAPADVVPKNPGDYYARGAATTITTKDVETVETPPPSPDREVLRALYDATEGAKWTKRDNWLTDAPLGEWHGVGIDDDGRVVRLSLADNNLRGNLPAELGDLTNLTELRLNRNKLSGGVPAELGGLSGLTELRLNRNKLSGRVPAELGGLSGLTELRLNRNKLKGRLPDALLSLSRLKTLHFGHNAGLCAPRTVAFAAWLKGIKIMSGPTCGG